jgi:hypothetical protein
MIRTFCVSLFFLAIASSAIAGEACETSDLAIREKALEAAALSYSHPPNSTRWFYWEQQYTDRVIRRAKKFEAYLKGEQKQKP